MTVNTPSRTRIVLCTILGLTTLISGYFLNNIKPTDPTLIKVLLNILPSCSLGLLVNILTIMFSTESKRKELAEETYNNLFPIVDNLLIKSQQETLSLKEYEILCNLTKTMGNLGKYCEVDVNPIHNIYQRLKQNPPTYVELDKGLYGALQTYNTTLINLNHAPTIADSGSAAIPVIR
jgi:hypothetical protein